MPAIDKVKKCLATYSLSKMCQLDIVYKIEVQNHLTIRQGTLFPNSLGKYWQRSARGLHPSRTFLSVNKFYH